MNEMMNGDEKLGDVVVKKMAGQVQVEIDEQFVQVSDLTAEQLQSMRPTLIILLGGSGHLVALHLKAALTLRFGPEWRSKIRILVFDTTEEPFALEAGGRYMRLEPSSEFFHIGNVPVPNILRNIHNLDSIRERFGSVLNQLPAGSLRNGAKSIPPLGLMALYWHYPEIYKQIRNALWELAERAQHGAEIVLQQQGINVIICSSLVGGTGSGLLVDVGALVRSLFDDLGVQGEFCHITGLAFLPQVFPNLPPTNLYANAAASLQEINELMVNGNFVARYPDGRRVHIRQALFDLFYVLDGVDERGQTWSGINEIAAMAAEGIYLQMGSQLGRKGENVFDNIDEVLLGQTDEGEGTFLSSFGLGYLEFPAPAVAELCSRWLLIEQIENAWLQPGGEGAASDQSATLLRSVTPGQLNSKLQRDPEGGELRLDLRLPGWLKNKSFEDVAGEAVRYVRDYGHVRVNEGILRKIEQNVQATVQREAEAWLEWANGSLFAPDISLLQLKAVVESSQLQLQAWMKESHSQLATLGKTQERQAVALGQAETAVMKAVQSLLIGRRGRVNQALEQLFTTAGELYATQIQIGLLQAQRQVWSELSTSLEAIERRVRRLADRLAAIAAENTVATTRQLEWLQDGGVSRLSLADEQYVRALYEEHAPQQLNMQVRLAGGEPLALCELATAELGRTLLAAVDSLFEPIRQMTVEEVIEARSDEMSSRARRQQLFKLATPSWNVDRARLPEGGSEMKRIEVMGVPNAARTIFDNETTLVSTHDPHRLTALVVVAGAPPSALQQYERYQQALEKVRKLRPVFVLPQFLAEAGQARLAFALGSIFGFIYNQGAHFYYRPGDELKSPQHLENGLAKAIAALEAEDGLVREIMDRVEAQIARLGLQTAIETFTEYYSSVPEGRTALDELVRELKQLVRDYTEELRQINDYSSGLKA